MNPDHQPKKENFLKEILKFAIIAVIIIVPIRTWVAEPFIVSGLSMFPTFNNGQYLIVDQLSYNFQKPERGDVIIFRYPLDPSVYFIKRIIGLPGEIVTIKDGIVTITPPMGTQGTTTSFVVPQDYVAADHRSYDTPEPMTLTSTQYFVMGDNRSQSADSRIWGPLDEKYIIGRPILRLFPPSSASIFPGRIDLGHN